MATGGCEWMTLQKSTFLFLNRDNILAYNSKFRAGSLSEDTGHGLRGIRFPVLSSPLRHFLPEGVLAFAEEGVNRIETPQNLARMRRGPPFFSARCPRLLVDSRFACGAETIGRSGLSLLEARRATTALR